MRLDAQLQFSDAQALAASGPSANVIDLSTARDLGIGEPLAALVTVDTGLAGTGPTFQVQVQVDNAEAFPSARTVIESEVLSAAPAGRRLVVPLPQGTDEPFIRLNYLLGGTGPSITVTAHLQPLSMVQGDKVYPAGFSIA